MIDRRSIMTLAVKGRYTSKPRPWVVIQSDDFMETDSVVLCATTHTLVPGAGFLRIDVTPSETNGLRLPTQLQAEKIVTVRRDDLDQFIGRLETQYMDRLDQALRGVLQL